LKPNFSKETEDQWDIVKFFDSHPKWSEFAQVLTHEIETQTSVDTQVPVNNAAAGGSELNNLLNTFLEEGMNENQESNEEEAEAEGDSSDSDEAEE